MSEPILPHIPYPTESGFVLMDSETASWSELAPEGSPYEMDANKRTPEKEWTRLIQVNYDGKEVVIIDTTSEDSVSQIQRLRDCLEKGYTAVLHNSIYDLPRLAKLGITPYRVFDTLQASQLCYCGMPEYRHSLDLVMLREVGVDPYAEIMRPAFMNEYLGAKEMGAVNADDVLAVKLSGAKKSLQLSDWSKPILTPEQLAYAAADVGEEYLAVYRRLAKRLVERGQHHTFDLEMQFVPIVAQMSASGIKHNLKKWKEFIADKQAQYNELEAKLLSYLDKLCQLTFPERYLITLRRKKPLPEKKNRKGEITQEAQTVGDLGKIQPKPELSPIGEIIPELLAREDGDVRVGGVIRAELGLGAGEQVTLTKPALLKELFEKLLGLEETDGFDKEEVKSIVDVARRRGRDELAAWLEDYQTAAKMRKLISTYGESFWKYCDRGGYIHASFSTTQSDTNRVQASEPNVLNEPRDLQKMLWCCEEDEAIVKADYSAQEARLLFYVGNQMDIYERMLKGLDIHSMSYSIISGMPYETLVDQTPGKKDKVKPEFDDKRTGAKAVTFAPMFGAGAGKAAALLGVDWKAGDDFIRNYWATFPKVKQMQDKQVYCALHHGYVTDLTFGRKRFFSMTPEERQRLANGEKRDEVLYRWRNPAMNYSAQATGATILRFAVIRLNNWIKANPEFGVTLRLTVHDAIVLTCKKEYAQYVGRVLRRIMETAATEVVPGIYISVDVDIYLDKTAPRYFNEEDSCPESRKVPCPTDGQLKSSTVEPSLSTKIESLEETSIAS